MNPSKCILAKDEIPFWGMIVTRDGIKPDPSKVEALKSAGQPRSKEEVISFLCFVQSFSDFIPNLARKTVHLKLLTKKHAQFRWNKECRREFNELKGAICDDTLLRYFDIRLPTFILVDAHQTGISAILAQGENVDSCKPVAFASRATKDEERRYPQLDLEALAIDFGLRRFRLYVVGAPKINTVVTDHKPLISIFANSRTGSTRTDRIKLRHQDINYTVIWRNGKNNPADYLSRHATPFSKIPRSWTLETSEFEKTVWFLQYGPYTESISMQRIIEETSKDPTLIKLDQQIKKGFIPKSLTDLSPYRKFFDELSISDVGLILKGDKIILPEKLWQVAIKKAHQGGHQGMNCLKRRIRRHFLFPRLDCLIEKKVKLCKPCQMFTNKTTKEPLKIIKHPEEAWQDVSIDLFGPMPDKKHIVVVQDMNTQFPAAKVVPSTGGDHVISAIDNIYADFGYPNIHRTDKGPPFDLQ